MAVARAGDYCVVIYKLYPKGKTLKSGSKIYFAKKEEFKTNMHGSNIIQMMFLEKMNIVITCGSGEDTTIKVWNMAGDCIKKLNTNSIRHHFV